MKWSRFLSFGGISFLVVFISIFFSAQASLKAFSQIAPRYEFLQKGSETVVREEGGKLSVDTGKSEMTEIEFFGKDRLRLSHETKAEIFFLPEGVKVLLKDGEIWISRLHGSPNMLVQTGSTTVFPALGSGAVSSDGPLLQASSMPLFSAAWPSEIPKWAELFDESNPKVFITFPFESSKAGITEKSDIEGKPCSQDGCKNFHPWFQKNEELDAALLAGKKQDLKKQIAEKGVHFSDVSGFAFGLKKNFLAFKNFFSVREDTEDRNIKELSSLLLDDTFYYISLGQQQEADKRFSLASKLIASLRDAATIKSFWLDAYRSNAWIEADDLFASLRDSLRYEVIKQEGEESPLLALESVRDSFAAVSSKRPEDFPFLLKKYESEVTNFFPQAEKTPQGFDALNEQIFQHLFEKNPTLLFSKAFLQSLFFFEIRAEQGKALGSLLEKKVSLLEKGLSLLPEHEPFEELQQALLELASQAKKLLGMLQPDNAARLNAEKYFEEKAREFSFLVSEFATGKEDFKTRYQAFLDHDEENKKIESLLYGSFEETGEEGAKNDDIQVKEDFASIGLKTYELIIPTEGEWYGILKGVFASVEFRAHYSPRRKAFRNIVVRNQVYPFSVPLEKFALFLRSTSVEGSPIIVTTKTDASSAKALPQESKLEKLLRVRVLDKLQALGLTAEENDIMITDADKAIVTIKKATFEIPETHQTISIAFIFLNTTNEVKELRVQTLLNEILVSEAFPSKDLLERARLIYERAKFEKERLEAEEKIQDQAAETR